MDANKKVNRALQAGALACGAHVEIADSPGYLPLINNEGLTGLFRSNAALLVDPNLISEITHHAASTDMGDLAQIMPVIHPWIGGVSGNAHTRDFKVVDPHMAYIIPAQCMAMTLIDLLVDGAATAGHVLQTYQPVMSKDEYLAFMDSIN